MQGRCDEDAWHCLMNMRGVRNEHCVAFSCFLILILSAINYLRLVYQRHVKSELSDEMHVIRLDVIVILEVVKSMDG